MNKARYQWLAAVYAVLLSNAAGASDGVERRVTFGGFGTLAALHHDTAGVEYRRSINQSEGARAGELSFSTDTRAGVQLNAAWSPQWEAVVQAVTRLDADGSWQPQLTRAFGRYTRDESLELRAGRLGWEIFPRADSRDIGYSQLTIRPPPEVFGVVASESFDGAELALTRALDDALIAVQLYGGRAVHPFVAEDRHPIDIEAIVWGGHLDYLRGPWILRLGTGVFELDAVRSLEPLLAGLRASGEPQAQALADDLDSRERRTLFFVAGATYDAGPLQARLFLGRTEHSGASSVNAHTGQLTGGYNFGQVTPYASLAFVDSYDHVRPTGLPDSPAYAPLNAGAAAVQAATQFNQTGVALGLRWDFRPKRALKFQIDRVWVEDSRLILDYRSPPGGNAALTLFGVALDFVF